MPNPGKGSSNTFDPNLISAKRAEYQDILSDLALLDLDNDASRVLNYNKREVLRLLEQIRCTEPLKKTRGGETPVPGWLNVRETMVGAVASGKPSSKPSGRVKDEAITSLGHLFYLAGAQMTSMLDDSLEALLTVLRDGESSERRRVLTAKALGEMCWCNTSAQTKLHAKGGVQTLVECVYNYRQQPSAARWSCHSLTVLLANNGDIWKHLHQLEVLEGTLAQLAAEESLWMHWDNNHASILHDLLYGPGYVNK